MASIIEQQVRLKIFLHYVQGVFTDHEIHYSAAYGTLLGALRHKDIIPWDDDIDLMVLPADIRKIELLSGEPDIGFFYEWAPMAICPRIYALEEGGSPNRTLWIDLFPFVSLGNSIHEAKKQYHSICALYFRNIAEKSSWRSIWCKWSHAEKKKSVYCRFLFARILGKIKGSQWGRFYQLLMNTHNAFYGGTIFPPSIEPKTITQLPWFENTNSSLFGNQRVPIPEHSDIFLESWYGDFESLPKSISSHLKWDEDLDAILRNYKSGRMP